MKILHTVESYHPSVGGMQEVVRQLSERLVKMGHEVTVAAGFHPERMQNICNGVKIEQFKISGNDANGIRGEVKEVERYKNFVCDYGFDIVTNFAAQQWATDLLLPVLKELKAKKVFVPTGFSGLYLPRFKNYFELMKARMKDYDMNIFLSDNYRDINFARENGITATTLIPNGAAEEEFLGESTIDIRKRLGIGEKDFLVLHVGSYTGIKGHREALEIFVRSKIENGLLLMIGNDNEHFKRHMRFHHSYFKLNLLRILKGKRVIITSLKREETVAAYKTADLFLFPSNIECSPIVLFECMAAKTPFLTADVGNAKEIIEWSDAGVILPTKIDKDGRSHVEINRSVEALNSLYDDVDKRKTLAESGFKAWKEKFGWQVIANQYENVYKRLISV
ncbi:MAG: glycosyltransferase family 4 protein [Bacteroidetes bacterium]|nr:glycosyltransferase family 4 protein [Bacteroidota bacterium]